MSNITINHDGRIVLSSLWGSCSNGEIQPELFNTFAEDILYKWTHAENILVIVESLHNLLMSEHCRYKSYLLYFNYVNDERSTNRHLLVTYESWTMVINKKLPLC